MELFTPPKYKHFFLKFITKNNSLPVLLFCHPILKPLPLLSHKLPAQAHMFNTIHSSTLNLISSLI